MAEEYQSRVPRDRYSHEEDLQRALDGCRVGRTECWTGVCFALSQPVSLNDDRKFSAGTDIRNLPGWQTASEELRAELMQLARTFLLRDATPEPPPKRIPIKFFGLVYALSLHADRLIADPELRGVAKPLWVQALLRRSSLSGKSVAGYLTALTDASPAIVASAFEREFCSMWDGDEQIYDEFLSGVWSQHAEDALVRILACSPIQPASYESGMNLLRQHNRLRAVELARHRLLEHSTVSDSPARRSAIAVCLFTLNELWENAWPYFVADLAVARQIIIECRRWLELPRDDKRISAMPRQFVAELHNVLVQVFPLNSTLHRTGARSPGPEDEAYDLQSALRDELEQRGAYQELKQALDLYPDLHQQWWVGRSLERAKTNAHALRRIPPNVVEFIRFLVTERGTFVRDNDSLQNAVLASVRRFDNQLHPFVIASIWEGPKPRSEAALQIELVRHLKGDFEKKGIVVNMEVKVEGKQGVDILVEAPPYSVTLEVKQAHGNDRDRPVRESMRLQLCDTYLANTGGTHGIYIVGWYFCPAYRPRGRTDMKTIAEARAYFGEQAKQLSTGRLSIISIVLNCAWRDSITAQAKRSKQSKHRTSSK